MMALGGTRLPAHQTPQQGPLCLLLRLQHRRRQSQQVEHRFRRGHLRGIVAAKPWAHADSRGRHVADALVGAGIRVSAAVLPGATFTLGAPTALFNTSGYASNVVSLYHDVSPDGQPFPLLHPPVATAPGGEVALVQITKWAAEVRAKLAGAVQ